MSQIESSWGRPCRHDVAFKELCASLLLQAAWLWEAAALCSLCKAGPLALWQLSWWGTAACCLERVPDMLACQLASGPRRPCLGGTLRSLPLSDSIFSICCIKC